MRRFGRWMFNGLTALSLMLCVTTVVVWIRSEFDWDSWFEAYPDSAASRNWTAKAIITDSGRLAILRDQMIGQKPVVHSRPWTHIPPHSYSPPGPHGSMNNVHWLWFYHGPFNGPAHVRTELIVRLWMIALLTSVVPVVWLWRWRLRCRTQWRRKNRWCTSCGYDLRATPERCPECGTVVAKAKIPNKRVTRGPLPRNPVKPRLCV